MILAKIVEKKRKEVEATKKEFPLSAIKEALARQKRLLRDFKKHISKQGAISIIAELKKASPSAGLLREDYNPEYIAELYEANGASAVSVLTERDFFKGSISDLEEAREKITLPVLRKDFIIDEYQVYESAWIGADAILLIPDILTQLELEDFVAKAKEFNMDCLVEVHTRDDIKKAVKGKAEIIGINNRNLHTLEVDLNTTSSLIGFIPKDKVIVSESGIKTYEDIIYLKSMGLNAVLIGETFMSSRDIGAKVREFTGAH